MSMAASVLFCIACIEEQVLYLNGSPQNPSTQPSLSMLRKKAAFLEEAISSQARQGSRLSWATTWSALELESPQLSPTTIWVTTTVRTSKRTNASNLRKSLKQVFLMTQLNLIQFYTLTVTIKLITKSLLNIVHSSKIQRGPLMSTLPRSSWMVLTPSLPTMFARTPYLLPHWW